LSLRGITKPVHLVVDYFYCGMSAIAMKKRLPPYARATIKRTDFGVDKYAPTLADAVIASKDWSALCVNTARRKKP
jgi:polyisoprenoid-binding protein YceI